jgi:hypothetical protein
MSGNLSFDEALAAAAMPRSGALDFVRRKIHSLRIENATLKETIEDVRKELEDCKLAQDAALGKMTKEQAQKLKEVAVLLSEGREARASLRQLERSSKSMASKNLLKILRNERDQRFMMRERLEFAFEEGKMLIDSRKKAEETLSESRKVFEDELNRIKDVYERKLSQMDPKISTGDAAQKKFAIATAAILSELEDLEKFIVQND